MPGTEINGNITAMSAVSQQLSAPDLPPSLARLGTMPSLAGLFEGIAMSVLDKAATASMSAFMGKVTEDIATFSGKTRTAAITYSAADVASALELAGKATKVIKQGVDFVKQSSAAQPGEEKPSTTEPSGENPPASV
ncbi:hypothetical protein ACFORH_33515 [Amycolatopsis roodepoortensis]|uniref:ESX-1 secretion-associated protein n=1 Tax=Amycolatopsis roodepoortensis TaxID=700274 RepID=A0ABR9L4J0_9PSEU|nr:hypothetical protein [Amycolatopsis roodepoortensis]MBE1575277.1 hypothetical protein [Amycolatopsis roodepoortensis]